MGPCASVHSDLGSAEQRRDPTALQFCPLGRGNATTLASSNGMNAEALERKDQGTADSCYRRHFGGKQGGSGWV